ncbi:MAG: hypothetical protein ACI4QZ_04230 [Eubacteriales bacterium]
MNKRDYEIISSEPAFWSRIGFSDDPTRLDENGKVTFYSENWDNFIREHKSFAEKGIKLHTGILHNGWVGVSEYDFCDVKNEKTYKGDRIDVHIESKGAAVFTESNAF